MVQTITLVVLGQQRPQVSLEQSLKSQMLQIARRNLKQDASIIVHRSNQTTTLSTEFSPAFQAEVRQRRMSHPRRSELSIPKAEITRQFDSLARQISIGKKLSQFERVLSFPNSPTYTTATAKYYPVVDGHTTGGNAGYIIVQFDVESKIVTTISWRAAPRIERFPAETLVKSQAKTLSRKTGATIRGPYYHYVYTQQTARAAFMAEYSDKSFEMYDVNTLNLLHGRTIRKSSGGTVKNTTESKIIKLR